MSSTWTQTEYSPVEKIVEFDIVRAQDYVDFVDKVEKKLQAGWELRGEMIILDKPYAYVYIQQMVRKEQKG